MEYSCAPASSVWSIIVFLIVTMVPEKIHGNRENMIISGTHTRSNRMADAYIRITGFNVGFIIINKYLGGIK